MKRPQVAPEEV